MVTCELCGKQFKNSQGLRGHKNFVHDISSNNNQQLVTRLATEQPVSKLEDRLQQLEYVTGLSEYDTDEIPLTDQLDNITEQLGKLSTSVSKLSTDVGQAKATMMTMKTDKEYYDKRSDELHRKFKEELNTFTIFLDSHCDSLNHEFTILGSRIEKVEKIVGDLDEGSKTTITKLATHTHSELRSIPELITKVGSFEQLLNGIQSEIRYLKQVTSRFPTGAIEQLRLTDGKDHNFRVYKFNRGLNKPHEIEHLLEPNTWVDLSEPED